ncbi:MAG: hypothetical protein K2M42_11705 [Oscillospiraceae bacterium]|nr:hypothetical protein [Oscillospiraceae bacterium]
MEQWQDHFGGKCFITDLGSSQTVELDGRTTELDRYAVWAPAGEGHQIVEVGAQLDVLQKKYGVPIERVCALTQS